MKRRIVQSRKLSNEDHRSTFENCPHCDHVMKSRQWNKLAEVLVLEPIPWRSGAVAIISECPKCFEHSWVHMPMDCFTDYNDEYIKTWKEAVKELQKIVKLEALRRWGRGLCYRCTKLKAGKIDHTAFRECEIGFGSVQTECDEFVELKT